MSNDPQQNKLISKLGVLLIEDSESLNKTKKETKETQTKKSSSSSNIDYNAFSTSSTDKNNFNQFNHLYQPYSFNVIPQSYNPGLYYNYYMPNELVGYIPTYQVNYLQQPSPNYFSTPIPSKDKPKRKKDLKKENQNFKKFLYGFDRDSFVDYLCSSKGCSYMQTFLPDISVEEVDYLINLIGNKLNTVITDNYANYFFQKLINNFTPKQKTEIIKAIKNDFTYIAQNPSGTHSLQTLFEQVDNNEQSELIQAYVITNFVELCTVSNKYLICSA